MPRLFSFPIKFGSVPAAVPSVVTTPAQEAAGRWGAVSASASAWNVPVGSTRRFEHVRWATGRREWNGRQLSGQLNFVVDSNSGFLIASNGVAVIASESTLNR